MTDSEQQGSFGASHSTEEETAHPRGQVASLCLPDSEPLTSTIKRRWGRKKGPGQGCEPSCLQDHRRLESRSHTAAAATGSPAPWRRPFLHISVSTQGAICPPEDIWQRWETFLLLPMGVGGCGASGEERPECSAQGCPAIKNHLTQMSTALGLRNPGFWILAEVDHAAFSCYTRMLEEIQEVTALF